MYCESIVTQVRHDVRGVERKDSFFILDADPREPFALEALGECYVDPESMRLLQDWLNGPSSRYQMLVSLDYKYALLREAEEEFVTKHGEEVLPMLPNPVFGPPTEKLIPALTRELRNDPVDRLRYGLKSKGLELKKRISFAGMDVLEFDPIFFLYEGEPGNERDVNLIWRYIANETPDANIPHVRKEIYERIYSGWKADQPWFDASELTFDELDLLRERARIHYERLMNCNGEGGYFVLSDTKGKKVAEYLNGIKDLAELLELFVVVVERLHKQESSTAPFDFESNLATSDMDFLKITKDSHHHSPYMVCCGTAGSHAREEERKMRDRARPNWDTLNPAFMKRLNYLVGKSQRPIYRANQDVAGVFGDQEDWMP
jgi:hypothetical protein